MARAMWTGAVSFGLVNVPVAAYVAVREHTVRFHQLEKGTGARVRYQKVSEQSGRVLDSDDIESGYEATRGSYVVVDPGELDAMRPRSTRTIEIEDFVDLAEVDPVFFDRTYWLAPSGEGAAKAYGLLAAALEKRGRAGIGTVVIRQKQALAAIRPFDGFLALSTMRFADEVVDSSSIDAIPSKALKPAAKELDLAGQIIDSLTRPWEPDRYHDTYTDEVRQMLARKAEGGEIVAEEPAEPTAEITDLAEALRASLESTRGGRKGSGAGPKRPSTGRRPAKSTRAGKSASKRTGATARKSA
jgi:DNA end-binding protein Ku